MRVLLVIIALLLPVQALADVEGIVNSHVVVREVTREQARDIYLLKERVGPYGNRPQLFRFPLRHKLHREFVRDVLGMTESQFDKEWLKLVNAGLATEISQVDTESEMIRAVSRRQFGVGYLSKNYLVLNAGGYDVEIIRVLP